MKKLDRMVVGAMICVLSIALIIPIVTVMVGAADLDSGWVTSTRTVNILGLEINVATVGARVAGHTIQAPGYDSIDPFYFGTIASTSVTVFDSCAFEYKSYTSWPGYSCDWTKGTLSVIYYQYGYWYTLYTDNPPIQGPVSDRLISRDLYPPGGIMLKGECEAHFSDLLHLDVFTLDTIAYLST